MQLPSRIRGWLITKTNTETSPEQLLAQYYATGKDAYLSLLVERFNRNLYHYLLSQSDQNTAEDVLQNTWLKVMRFQQNTNNQAAVSNVKSWLFTIARNTLIDHCRQQQKWLWTELSDQEIKVASLTEQLEQADQLTRFNIAVQALPFYQREALIFQQEGFSVNDICQLTGESFETVKSRLRYAKQTLKTCLEVKS